MKMEKLHSRLLYKYLKKNGILQDYLYNIRPTLYINGLINKKNIFTCLESEIRESFTWRRSREGWAFWNHHNYEYSMYRHSFFNFNTHRREAVAKSLLQIMLRKLTPKWKLKRRYNR